ncbi:hypothetical protein C8J57DRAFT_1468741 [Mycena rebaudengoi]|nr:hypothetical protein C8J57DRAFT_1468741 [Mycena rebaudengoi]
MSSKAVWTLLLHFLTFSTFISSHTFSTILVQARAVPQNGRRDDLGFSAASWIWLPGSDGSARIFAGSANAAFLKTFSSPAGKNASSAVILMTAADHFTLWVNGQPIGDSASVETGGPDDWKSARVLRAGLNASSNVFAVSVVDNPKSTAPAQGLLAAVQIVYSDGTQDRFVSDASWLVSGSASANFMSLNETTNFTAAAIDAPYGDQPWGASVVIPPADPKTPDFPGSTWLWSTVNASVSAAPGTVGFRKRVPTPAGLTPKSASVLLTADNEFDLYVNGRYIGSPPARPNLDTAPDGWNRGQQFSALGLNQTEDNVFTVVARNLLLSGGGAVSNTPRSPAGFIGVIRVLYTDGSDNVIRTDASWLAGSLKDNADVAAFLATPDEELLPAVAQGEYGMAPWKEMVGIADVLAADSLSADWNALKGATANSNTEDEDEKRFGPTRPKTTLLIIAVVVFGGIALFGTIAVLVMWRRNKRARKGENQLEGYAQFDRESKV